MSPTQTLTPQQWRCVCTRTAKSAKTMAKHFGVCEERKLVMELKRAKEVHVAVGQLRKRLVVALLDTVENADGSDSNSELTTALESQIQQASALRSSLRTPYTQLQQRLSALEFERLAKERKKRLAKERRAKRARLIAKAEVEAERMESTRVKDAYRNCCCDLDMIEAVQAARRRSGLTEAEREMQRVWLERDLHRRECREECGCLEFCQT